jgi:hypothetical protein
VEPSSCHLLCCFQFPQFFFSISEFVFPVLCQAYLMPLFIPCLKDVCQEITVLGFLSHFLFSCLFDRLVCLEVWPYCFFHHFCTFITYNFATFQSLLLKEEINLNHMNHMVLIWFIAFLFMSVEINGLL